MIFLKMEKLLEHNTEVVSVKCSVICNGTSLGLYIQNLYALDVIIKSFFKSHESCVIARLRRSIQFCQSTKCSLPAFVKKWRPYTKWRLLS